MTLSSTIKRGKVCIFWEVSSPSLEDNTNYAYLQIRISSSPRYLGITKQNSPVLLLQVRLFDWDVGHLIMV
jgi:hypothetical protein